MVITTGASVNQTALFKHTAIKWLPSRAVYEPHSVSVWDRGLFGPRSALARFLAHNGVCYRELMLRPHLLHVVLFLSGLAGLGYEIVWTRMFAVGLGHELPSVLAVVTAFFGGLAIGAWAFDSSVSRSRRPGLWYVGLELVIALWAVITVAAIPYANEQVVSLTGLSPSPFRHWLIAFSVPFVTLLPATTAMGATLPAMERVLSRVTQSDRRVSGLYGANTLGAVAGVLLTTFVLMPAMGLRDSVLMLVGANVLGITLFVAYFLPGEADRSPIHTSNSASNHGVLFVAFGTGLLGIGYEVLGVRFIGQVLENTIYSFASVLSVYLLGTALGAAIYQRVSPRLPFSVVLGRLLGSLAASCAFGVGLMYGAADLYEWVRSALGATFAASVAAELALGAAVFLAPTMLMGATFGHLGQEARGRDGGVGRVLGVNTAGGSLSSVVFVVLVLPAFGAKAALLVVVVGYLLMIPRGQRRMGVPGVVLVLLLLFAAPPLRHVDLPAGGRLTEFREGVLATVAVVEAPNGARTLKVNNRFGMGSTLTWFAERRQGHLPLLLHENPGRALFLGLGTGDTFAAAADHSGLSAEAVELISDVIDVLPSFHSDTDPIFAEELLTIHLADAHRFVQATSRDYDVIVADLFHPARDGAGSLYTLEHFQRVRDRLAPGGLFCQWLPIYQLDEENLRVVIRTFLEVFPRSAAFLGLFNAEQPVLALVGSEQELAFDIDWIGRRVSTRSLSVALERVSLVTALDVFGCYLGGRESLEAFAGSGTLNTEDNQYVTYRAPRAVYMGHRPAQTNLRALLGTLTPKVGDLLGPARSGTRPARELSDYWRARDLYLEYEMLAANGRGAEALDVLFRSIEASADFRLGYTAVLVQAQILLRTDLESARTLLERLRRSQPNRPEAGDVLSRYFGG